MYNSGIIKRKVFLSYHHDGDQYYYNEFSKKFHDEYEAVTDNSLDRRVDSEDIDYVMRCIRECYITGTSWICPYISRHLLSLNPLLARCRRYSRGER